MSRVEAEQEPLLRRRGQNPNAAGDPQERASNFETRDPHSITKLFRRQWPNRIQGGLSGRRTQFVDI